MSHINILTKNGLVHEKYRHTHDDPGWLITVDQYYIREVEWIFYTMIPVLQDNPTRKFTYVEVGFSVLYQKSTTMLYTSIHYTCTMCNVHT